MNDKLASAHIAFGRKDYQTTLDLLLPDEAAYATHEFALALIANASLLSGQLDAAVRGLERLVELKPEKVQYRRMFSQALNRAGAGARRSGRDADAQPLLKRALEIWPDNTDARFNLALLYQRRRLFDIALPLWEHLHLADKDDAGVALEYADCLAQLERQDLGLPVFQHASVAYTNPALTLKWIEVAAHLGQTDAVAKALVDLDTPVAADASRLFELGDYLASASVTQSARAAYDAAFRALDDGRRSPGLRAAIASKLALPAVYTDAADIHAHRDRFLAGMDALEEQVTPGTINAGEKSLKQLAWSNFYLAYQGCDDRNPQTRYGHWLSRSAQLMSRRGPQETRRNGSTTTRIGMVGSIFRHCTAGSYFARWVDVLSSLGYEVDVFQLGPAFDDLTDSLERSARQVHRINTNLDTLSEQLHEAAFDLLIYPELGMDARMLPLAALRLAYRQASAWGHPVTTGLPTIDGFFSCTEMEPAYAQDHYSESLLLLPGLGTEYTRPAMPSPATRLELGLPETGRLYLMPQSLFKMHPDNDAVMAAIAAGDPQATLVMFRGQGGAALAPYRCRVESALRTVGADPERQLLFLPMGSRDRYLQINRSCNVMVDSLHWSGGNTSIDALCSGLPIVTCPGRFMRSRQSAAMLRRIGLTDLIVERPGDVAANAMAIAMDPERRQTLNHRIADGLPTLFDTSGLADALQFHIERLLAI